MSDAAHIRGMPEPYRDNARRLRSAKAASDELAGALNFLRERHLGGSLGGLPVLCFAVIAYLMLAAPALADFQSAVDAYERGALEEARQKFETVAEDGDQRALPYLESIRQLLDRDGDTAMPAPLVTDAGPLSSTSGRVPAGNDFGPDLGDLWGGVSDSDLAAESEIALTERQSPWSRVFHLPGDVTLIGLQHAARFFDAEDLSRDLREESLNGDAIALSVLAGIWWLLIAKGAVGMGVGLGRLFKATTTRNEIRRYR